VQVVSIQRAGNVASLPFLYRHATRRPYKVARNDRSSSAAEQGGIDAVRHGAPRPTLDEF